MRRFAFVAVAASALGLATACPSREWSSRSAPGADATRARGAAERRPGRDAGRPIVNAPTGDAGGPRGPASRKGDGRDLDADGPRGADADRDDRSASIVTFVPEGTLAPIAAWDGELVADRLVVLEPDLRAVRAVDPATGDTLWRTTFQQRSEGVFEMAQLSERRLLVHGGRHLNVFDLEDGRLMARRLGPFNRADDRVFLWRNGGLCGLRQSCSMQLVDCLDARLIGRAIQGRIIHRTPISGGASHRGCWGFSPVLVGRHGRLAVAVGDNDPGRSGVADAEETQAMTVAIDAETGEDLWTSTSTSCAYCRRDACGMSPDGSTCWLTDSEGATTIFACQTGRALSRPATKARVAVWVTGPSAGLFLFGYGEGSMIEPGSWAARWTREYPVTTVAMPVGARLPESGYLPRSTVRTLQLIEPSNGKVLDAVPLPRGARLMPTEGGGLSVEGTGRAWSATGKAVVIADATAARFEVVRSAGASRGSEVRAVGSRQVVARFATDAWALGEVATPAGEKLVIYVSSPDGPGAIHILPATRAPPARE